MVNYSSFVCTFLQRVTRVDKEIDAWCCKECRELWYSYLSRIGDLFLEIIIMFEE